MLRLARKREMNESCFDSFILSPRLLLLLVAVVLVVEHLRLLGLQVREPGAGLALAVEVGHAALGHVHLCLVGRSHAEVALVVLRHEVWLTGIRIEP